MAGFRSANASLKEKQWLEDLESAYEDYFGEKATADIEPISLAEFFRESWQSLEPATELVWNWHLESICFHAQELFLDWFRHYKDPGYQQRARNLLVNVPPGSAKSRIISVCLPAWIWTIHPSFKMIFLSANPRVALRDSVLCRDLIESEWYQKRFQPSWHLRLDQNAKSSYWNSAGGFRNAGGFSSRITGDRADLLAWDDPHDAEEVNSDTKRMHVLERWDNAIRNRVNNPQTSLRLGIMQRLHALDLAGHVLLKEKWDHLCIPQEFEREREPTAFGWKDPRTKPGELMFPARFSAKFVADEKISLGEYGYSAQHQQNPSPTGGGMFKIENWMLYAELPKVDRWLLSVDATFKKTSSSDYVSINALAEQARAIKVQRMVVDERGQSRLVDVWLSNYFIPGCWHDRAGIVDTQNAILEMKQNFPYVSKVIIEDKANGSSIIEQMQNALPEIEPFNPGSESKLSRAWSIQPIHERGGMFLPLSRSAAIQLKGLGRNTISLREWWDLNTPPHRVNAEHAPVDDWAKGLIDEFSTFPTGAFDDRVDSVDQGIIWSEQNNIPSAYVPMGTTK